MSAELDVQHGAIVTRWTAARQLLTRLQLRESLSLTPQPLASLSLIAGAQTALTTLIVLPLVYLSPWPQLIGYASLGALVTLFGRFAPPAERVGIVLRCAIWQVFAVFSMSLLVWLGAPALIQILALAIACGLFFYVAESGRFGPPGPLIFVFASSAAMGESITLLELLQATSATAIVAALAFAICWFTEPFRGARAAKMVLPSLPVPPRGQRLYAAARIILASAIAALVAYALGAMYPGWAAMGALAVMQAPRLNASMNRSLQRMVGTTVGALLVGLVLAQAPSVWPVIGLLLLLIVSTEVIIGFNYGLGQMLVTPMALLMTYLASQQTAGSSMIYERIWDTLLGASIGIVMALLFSTLADRMILAQHHARRLNG